MRNPDKERLENKLRLWETPGFSQFIEDLNRMKGDVFTIKTTVDSMKKIYQAELRKIEEKENKFKQGKLKL